MKKRHVISHFPAWIEGRVDDTERRDIQRHLDQCSGCRRFFDEMTRVLEGFDPASLPHLEPDPYLPVRIKALASGDPTAVTEEKAGSQAALPPLLGRLRKTAITAIGLAAATIGIILGIGLSSRVTASSLAEDEAIASAYREAFSPSGVSSGWEYAMDDENTEDDS